MVNCVLLVVQQHQTMSCGLAHKWWTQLCLLLVAVHVTASDSLPPSSSSSTKSWPVGSQQVKPTDFHSVAAGSAFIVPSSALREVRPPSLDLTGFQPNVSASIGRTAYLRCKVKDLGHKSVSWVRHSDVSLISVGKYKYIKDERFRIVHEHHDEDWILAIKSVSHEDEGYYECQVNSSPLLRQGIYLNVVEPYTEIVGGKDVFIDQHSAINLTCLIHAPEPPAHIFWMHNGKPVSPQASLTKSYASVGDPRASVDKRRGEGSTTSSLLIASASPRDSGLYECNPSNTGPASINVHVLDGELPDALQTSGLSTFTASRNTLLFIWMAGWTLIILAT